MFKIIFIILSSIISFQTNAHIVIDIEPEEMQRIAEILVENYISHNITPQISTRSSVLLKI